MTLTNESASLYAQVLPVFLVLLAIEGRGVHYGKLGRSWRAVLIGIRWLAVGCCLSGTTLGVSWVAVNGDGLNGGLYGILMQVFFFFATFSLLGVFLAMQMQEGRENIEAP